MKPINKHIHLSDEEVKQYIFAEHQLTKAAIEQIELELQVCDVCSDKYISILENMEFQVEPALTEERYEKVISTIAQLETNVVTIPNKKKWYEYGIVHYVAAASITGVLFISGFLSVMTNLLNTPMPEQSIEQTIQSDDTWFNLSEQQWVKHFQQYMNELQQFELFKEEK